MARSHGAIPISSSLVSSPIKLPMPSTMRSATVPGVKLEHKGVSVTVHVRAVEMGRRQDVLRAAMDAARPWLDSGALKSLDASEAVEFLPNIPWTKGDAVRWIVEDIETQCASAGVVRLLRRRRDRRGRVSRRAAWAHRRRRTHGHRWRACDSTLRRMSQPCWRM